MAGNGWNGGKWENGSAKDQGKYVYSQYSVKVTHRSFGKDLKDMPGVRINDTANSKVLLLHL